jgi:glycosyltransferase involved in cell wall biosynthesis
MRYLFIHQNFPGQFRHVAKVLADDPGNEVIGIVDANNLKSKPVLHPRIRVLSYQPHQSGHKETHHYLRDFEGHIRRGQALVRLLLKLHDEEGFKPDVIMAHPGWGEGLFLKDVFPDAKIIHYLEFYYQGTGSDVGFDPEFPTTFDDQFRVRIKNSTQLHSLTGCDYGISQTNWQKTRYPTAFHEKIEVIHEGIDTTVVCPNPNASITINGQRFQVGDEIITYVARNLEPYRGIHTFIRSIPDIQSKRPNARIIIVGGNEVSYGKKLPQGETYRQRYCAEIKDKVDWSKVFFVGKLPYADYLKVLQVSAAHIYLTYPFVLSWSMLEAMAAGCLLIASDTPPVREVITDGENGLLVGFFDHERLATLIDQALSGSTESQKMRFAARQKIVNEYDLATICLPKLLKKIS